MFKDRGSKFLSFAYPVSSEEEIKDILDAVKKKYHDARHHCYAWVLGADRSHYRENDDGEPSNTAGKPILGQIQTLGLTNVLVVVVRYFGGVLLGTGGLINAYRNASRNALENARITKQYLYLYFELRFSYSEMNTVLKIIKDTNAEPFDQSFELSCFMKARILKKTKTYFEESFKQYPSVSLKLIAED
jgi:uncharacterized YigZ family protein